MQLPFSLSGKRSPVFPDRTIIPSPPASQAGSLEWNDTCDGTHPRPGQSSYSSLLATVMPKPRTTNGVAYNRFISAQAWRLEVQTEGVCRARRPPKSLPNLVVPCVFCSSWCHSNLYFYLHLYPSSLCLCVFAQHSRLCLSFLGGHLSCWIKDPSCSIMTLW